MVACQRVRRRRALKTICKELSCFGFHATRPAFVLVGVLQPLAAMLQVRGSKAELGCVICQDIDTQIDAFGS